MKSLMAILVLVMCGCSASPAQMKACGETCGARGVRSVRWDVCYCYQPYVDTDNCQ